MSAKNISRHYLFLLSLVAIPALASTHGDNLIGIGAVSRTLSGAGVASSTDATGAISANPATLTGFVPTAAPGFELSVTLFRPRVEASVNGVSGRSASENYLIPSLAYAAATGNWSYGIVAYGVSGLGVDYRGTALDSALGPTPFPLVAAVRTELQVLKVAPAVAYQVSPQWSVGLAAHLDYGQLELGAGRKSGFGYGFQPGVVYRPVERLAFGFSLITPQPIAYRDVVDLDGDGAFDDLTLEAPRQWRLGASFDVLPGRLQLAAETSWVQWARARGYGEFDWVDTRAFTVAVQYRLVPDRVTLRAGYSRNGNPVRANQGWDGTGAPGNVRFVQGKPVNTYYYETFRVVGFPAIVTDHVSIGATFQFGPATKLELGFTHAFRNSLSEQGTNLLGTPVEITSTLSERSLELAYTRRF